MKRNKILHTTLFLLIFIQNSASANIFSRIWESLNPKHLIAKIKAKTNNVTKNIKNSSKTAKLSLGAGAISLASVIAVVSYKLFSKGNTKVKDLSFWGKIKNKLFSSKPSAKLLTILGTGAVLFSLFALLYKLFKRNRGNKKEDDDNNDPSKPTNPTTTQKNPGKINNSSNKNPKDPKNPKNNVQKNNNVNKPEQKNQNHLNKIKDQRIKDLENQILDLNQDFQNTTKISKGWNKLVYDKQKIIDNLEKHDQENKKKIEDLEKLVSGNQKINQGINNRIKNLSDKLKTQDDQDKLILNKQKKIDDLTKQDLENKKKIENFEKQIFNLRKKHSFDPQKSKDLEKYISDLKQLNKEEIKKNKKTLQQLQNERDKLKQNNVKIRFDYSKLLETQKKSFAKVKKSRDEREKQVNEINKLIQEKKKLQKKIKLLGTPKNKANKRDSIDSVELNNFIKEEEEKYKKKKEIQKDPWIQEAKKLVEKTTPEKAKKSTRNLPNSIKPLNQLTKKKAFKKEPTVEEIGQFYNQQQKQIESKKKNNKLPFGQIIDEIDTNSDSDSDTDTDSGTETETETDSDSDSGDYEDFKDITNGQKKKDEKTKKKQKNSDKKHAKSESLLEIESLIRDKQTKKFSKTINLKRLTKSLEGLNNSKKRNQTMQRRKEKIVLFKKPKSIKLTENKPKI
ncbi:hypothetical protein ACFLYU_03550 [Candidatus Dependentiae bacterium]